MAPLRVNPLFREALQQAPADKSELWQDDLEQGYFAGKMLAAAQPYDRAFNAKAWSSSSESLS